MSKFGVGVGEDFPVDENGKPEAEDLGHCHRGHQDQKEAWRRFRHQMHEEWHARRRAFRNRDAGEMLHHMRQHHLHHLIVGGLAVLGLAAIISGLRHRD
jgi:hypothetical protein